MSLEKWVKMNVDFRKQRDKQILMNRDELNRVKYITKGNRKRDGYENNARAKANSRALNKLKK